MLKVNLKYLKFYATGGYRFTCQFLKHEKYLHQLRLIITSGLEGGGEKNGVPICLTVSVTFYLSVNPSKYAKY